MSKMIKKGKKRSLASAIMAGGMLVTALAPTAGAQGIDTDIWGLPHDGSDMGNRVGKVNWFSISGTNGKSAWQIFKENNNLHEVVFQDRLEALKVDVDVCEKSDTVWFTGARDQEKGWWYWASWPDADTRMVLFNADGTLKSKAEHEKFGTIGTILSPYASIGAKPTQAQVNALFKQKGLSVNNHPWSIMCSGSFVPSDPQPVPDEWTEYTRAKDPKDPVERHPDDPKTPGNTTPGDESLTRNRNEALETTVETGVKKSWTDIINVNITGTPDIDPGKLPLEAQAATETTEFGELYKEAANNKHNGTTVDEMQKKVDEALATDSKAKYTMDLNKKNQDAIAEGGVMSFQQFDQPATITVSETVTTIEKRECTKTYTYKDGEWVPNTTCTDWTKEEVDKGSRVSNDLGTQKQVGFWQMLVVQCNPTEFESVKSALGDNVATSQMVEQENGVAGVLTTKTWKTVPAGGKKLGSAAQPDPLVKTSQDSFYDKECGLMCMADSAGTGIKGTGPSGNLISEDLPSPDDPGIKNGGVGVTVQDKTSGSAVPNDFNGKNLKIFRDNKIGRTITVNQWEPMIPVTSDGTLSTAVFKDPDGTPSSPSSTGNFWLTDKDGNNVFDPKGSVTNQKGWDKSYFRAANSAVLEGAQNVFGVRANWTSEQNKPEVLSVAWEYGVEGTAKGIPTTVGFGPETANGADGETNVPASVLSNPKDLTANIEGRCFAMFNDNERDLGGKYINDNTGSGSGTAFDSRFVQRPTLGEDGKWTEPGTDPYNIVIDVVRATSE